MPFKQYMVKKLARLIMWAFKHLDTNENALRTFSDIAVKTGTCCICGNPLHKPEVQAGYILEVHMFKRATWQGPVATLMAQGRFYTNFAVGLVCMDCKKLFGDNVEAMRNSIKFAVELDMRKKALVYHEVSKLEDYPLVIGD